MENKFLANNIIYIYLTILVIIPYIIAIGMLCFQYFWEALLICVFPTIFLILTFVFRKYFFNKILFNEQGIFVMYKNDILKEIKWAELKTIAVVSNNLLVFADFNFSEDSELFLHRNQYISFYASKKNCEVFAKYYHLTDKTILNIGKLGKLKNLFVK